ncbi:hypothetical protein Cob_v012423 [Colletotrichum orbiculare MAFF 240422]|uniref:Uncharacterized protein n=1 Tax=Colletotrichum orbiculare (strain 104-T / ATCC 96160 / CBS 514.97 / LARS 414 / MAFF 240422) TaxID=1213857 RepID=A0A484F8P9_COLOR|nr:hypothetical protein Cob_v012423 [Colletotrichum orbiculare MAFF 240422]
MYTASSVPSTGEQRDAMLRCLAPLRCPVRLPDYFLQRDFRSLAPLTHVRSHITGKRTTTNGQRWVPRSCGSVTDAGPLIGRFARISDISPNDCERSHTLLATDKNLRSLLT